MLHPVILELVEELMADLVIQGLIPIPGLLPGFPGTGLHGMWWISLGVCRDLRKTTLPMGWNLLLLVASTI